MKRFTKLIPLMFLVLTVGGCNKKPAEDKKSSEPETVQPSEPAQPSETEEQKALREAKERAQALLGTANEDNYIGDELAQLRNLKSALESAIANAQAPADLQESYDALDNFLKNAKTKAQYEAEQAAALEAAKQAATEYLATVNPDLYEGAELEQINILVGELNTLIDSSTDPSAISGKVQELSAYLATAKTKAEYEAERAAAALAQAKQDAEAYLATVDTSLYEGNELLDINDLIGEINGLLTTATSADQINASVQELKDYLATAKTKAEYEAERAAALAARQAERLKEVEYARPNRFRSEELAAIEDAKNEFTNAVNSAETIEEVNAVSISTFNAALAGKTNAQYMLDEMFSYRDPSSWLLVNQHAANYTHVPGGNNINSNNVGAEGIGYLMSPVKYQGDFELSMRLSTDNVNTSTVGLMFGNYHDKATGDGIDGYLVNYDVAADHQYVQIWYLQNAYQSYGESILQYIGGWVYNNEYPQGKLAERNIRVKYNGTTLRIMDDSEYLEFGEDNTFAIDVPLALSDNYAIDPGSKTYSFGFLNWDGNNLNGVRGVIVDELITDAPVISWQMARQVAIAEESRLDLSLYETDEQTQFNNKIAEIEALYDNNGTYAQIMAKVDEFIVLKKTLKTHEQWENERHPDISVQLLDNIYSGDPTKYTPSNWDLVDEHAFGSWTHEQGSHTVVTNGDAGYCMDAAVHTNFTVVIKVTGTQAINPYNAAWPDSAFIFGANTNGNYFTGIEVVLSQDWGFQLYDSMTGSVGDPGCYADQFKGGFATNSEGVTYRLTFVDGILKVYVVNPSTGVETQMAGVDAGFSDVTQWNLGSRSGHFGIMDWGGATTYEVLEFKDL